MYFLSLWFYKKGKKLSWLKLDWWPELDLGSQLTRYTVQLGANAYVSTFDWGHIAGFCRIWVYIIVSLELEVWQVVFRDYGEIRYT